MVRNAVKNGQSWCLAVICRKRRAFDKAILPHNSFNLFKKVCEIQPIARKKGLISSC